MKLWSIFFEDKENDVVYFVEHFFGSYAQACTRCVELDEAHEDQASIDMGSGHWWESAEKGYW